MMGKPFLGISLETSINYTIIPGKNILRKINTSGVYRITNIITEDFYIGSSIEIENRWCNHKSSAKTYRQGGRWRVSHLYQAMQKYGIDNFKFEVLEECRLDILREREQHYIDTLHPAYNRSLIATGGGAEWTIERKADYAARRKAEVAEGINVPPTTWMTGNKNFRHSEVSKQKMQKSMAKAVEKAIKERGSYLTPEGLASRKSKLEANLTPERRQRFVEETEEARRLAHATFRQKTEEFAERFAPLILALQDEGLNFKEIADRLTAQGYASRHGRRWTDQAVSDLLVRIGQSPNRPRLLPAEQTRKKNADAFAEQFFPMIDELRRSGLNMSDIAIKLNEGGHRSRRGADWTYANVREVIRRAQTLCREPDPLMSEILDYPRYVGWDRRR